MFHTQTQQPADFEEGELPAEEVQTEIKRIAVTDLTTTIREALSQAFVQEYPTLEIEFNQ